MKLTIQQRPIAIDSIFSRLANPQDDSGDVVFDVMDEMGNTIGIIKKIHRMGAQDYCAYDSNGNMIIKVHRDSMSFPPNCDIATRNGSLGTMARVMTFGALEYEVSFGGYSITGDAFGCFYNVAQRGTIVMRIVMDTPNLTKRYVIDASETVDSLTALALLISIDCLNDSKRR